MSRKVKTHMRKVNTCMITVRLGRQLDGAGATRAMERPIYPSDLSDKQWQTIAPLIPAPKPGGRPRVVDTRETVNAIPRAQRLRVAHAAHGLPAVEYSCGGIAPARQVFVPRPTGVAAADGNPRRMGIRTTKPNSHDQPDEPAAGPVPGIETVAFDERVFKNNTMT